MNIFLGIILLCLSTFVGYNFSLKFVKKREYYEEFNAFNKSFISAVSFSKKTLKELTNNTSDNDFLQLLKCAVNGDKILNPKYLDNEDFIFFNNYADKVGVGDKVSQLEYLKSLNTEIDNRLKISIENEKKYKMLYIKIGFLIGLICLIVLL